MTTSTGLPIATVPEIGKYHLIAELARGGMGNVYLAASQGPGGFSKLVAVKELKPELCDDETYVKMFLEEARLAARLIHPNVVQTNEVGSDGERHYMVMEFLDGRSLHRIGKRLGARWPVGAHLCVIAEALLGLHYAHELRGFDGAALGIVHRDVSPLNVFVTFNGQAKVLDLGIAKAVDSSVDTKSGVLKGRIAYMAPEQARGNKVDRRADIYAAGVMLWEAAAGRRLWPQMGEAEILARVLREGAPSLRSVQPHAPEELDFICARAMAYAREDRYATAVELLCDLESHLLRRDDTMTLREIGALVGQAFDPERRKMNAVIEEALTRARRGLRSGIMPASRGSRPALPTTPDIAVDRSLGAAAPLFTPSNTFAPSSGTSSESAPATAASLGPAIADAHTRTRSRRMGTPGVGVLLMGALVVLATAWHKGKAPAQASLAPTFEAAPAPVLAISSRQAPRTFHVVISASPKAVQVYVDDVAVANPYVADPVQDATVHRVRFEAPGYKAQARTLAFSQDVDLRIALDPVRSPQPSRRAAQSPPNAALNCDPPYIMDLATGAKHWRMECL